MYLIIIRAIFDLLLNYSNSRISRRNCYQKSIDRLLRNWNTKEKKERDQSCDYQANFNAKTIQKN